MATRTRETDALSESAEQRAALITKAGRRAAIAELPRGTHHQAKRHHERSPSPSRGKLHTKLRQPHHHAARGPLPEHDNEE